MNKKLIERIGDLFLQRLQIKTGWGKNEVIEIYKECVVKACLELIDDTGKNDGI
jgi:hypothetical protein